MYNFWILQPIRHSHEVSLGRKWYQIITIFLWIITLISIKSFRSYVTLKWTKNEPNWVKRILLWNICVQLLFGWLTNWMVSWDWSTIFRSLISSKIENKYFSRNFGGGGKMDWTQLKCLVVSWVYLKCQDLHTRNSSVPMAIEQKHLFNIP